VIGSAAIQGIVELDRIVFPATKTADVIAAWGFLPKREESATRARVMVLVARHSFASRLSQPTFAFTCCAKARRSTTRANTRSQCSHRTPWPATNVLRSESARSNPSRVSLRAVPNRFLANRDLWNASPCPIANRHEARKVPRLTRSVTLRTK